ncbi:MAG: substrate-binding domain-containing protein, partial [Bacteroidota bacterium]
GDSFTLLKNTVMRLIWIYCLWILLASLSWSCSSQAGASASDAYRTKVAVIPKGGSHQFWEQVAQGARNAGKETGLEVIWQSPELESNLEQQVQLVQDFVAQRVDAIVLAPLDSRGLVPAVKAARKRNIPVIIMDSELDAQELESFVATDNLKAGRLCAETLLAGIEKNPRIIMLRHIEGSASTTKREAGFLQGIAESGRKVRLLSVDQYAGPTVESAAEQAAALLKQYPKVNGIFCPNETSTEGMLQAIREAGLKQAPNFVGFDANPRLIAALEQGFIGGLALQDPINIGFQSVLTADKVIDGKPYETWIDTGVKMLTRENIEDADIRKLLEGIVP